MALSPLKKLKKQALDDHVKRFLQSKVVVYYHLTSTRSNEIPQRLLT